MAIPGLRKARGALFYRLNKTDKQIGKDILLNEFLHLVNLFQKIS